VSVDKECGRLVEKVYDCGGAMCPGGVGLEAPTFLKRYALPSQKRSLCFWKKIMIFFGKHQDVFLLL
jgi:hypothetical protein